jgi:hypothetical protein
MSFGWKRITTNVWRLDECWQVVEERPGCWRVYRGDKSIGDWVDTVAQAMEIAERLKREQDAISTNPGDGQ